MHTLYYLDHEQDAIALAKEQWNDEWDYSDIVKYWQLLGYDIFFIRRILKDANITPG